MKLLNWYILKKQLILYFIALPAFAFIAALILILEKIGNIKVFNFYDFSLFVLFSLPEKLYYVIPTVSVIVFFIVYRELQISKRIYPILLNGISLKYLYLPAFLFSIFVFVIELLNIEFIMPTTDKLASIHYKKLKGNNPEEEKHLITAHQWIKLNDTTFIYFGFLDLNQNKGKDFVFIQVKKDNFYPLYRIEAKDVKLDKNKIFLKKGKIVSLANIQNFEYTKFDNLDYPVKIDLKNLKKLIKIKKAVSISQFYKKAVIADKFGYPSGFFWSRFFSYTTSIFSPIVLILFTYPFLWLKRKEKYIIIVGLILLYWYLISALASLAETGAIPYFSPLFVNLFYAVLGIVFIKKIKFTEL